MKGPKHINGVTAIDLLKRGKTLTFRAVGRNKPEERVITFRPDEYGFDHMEVEWVKTIKSFQDSLLQDLGGYTTDGWEISE